MRNATSYLVALALATGTTVLTPAAQAKESGTIGGHVVNARTANPIAFATVWVEGARLGAATDINGYFTIRDVSPGTYKIHVNAVGYAPETREDIRVIKDSTTIVRFRLQERAVEGDTVVLRSSRDAINFNAPGSQRTTPAERIARLPVTTVDEVLSLELGFVGQGAELNVKGGCSAGVPCPPGGFNTEEYSRVYENRFLDVVGNPLSTFSIDVDGASYANVRRFLNLGQLPPPDAVRIEEMVNYFPFDYPEPEGDEPFSITTRVGDCPWNREHRLVQVALKGRALDCEELPPSNLVFLIDVSGSMQRPDKLPLLKSAFRMLVHQLREEDRVAIVVYAGAAGLVLPSTPGFDRSAILCAIDRLQAGGSTAGAAGIQLAYRVAREHFAKGGNNRIILATDGDFNVGISSTSDLLRMIEKERESGIFLSVLGFGTGNLKDSKMEQVADKGNGNYNYIDNVREARKVLVEQMGGTLVTIAKDVKIQVEFNPARVDSYRLVGYENRLLAKEDFNDDRKDAGELGLGHVVTALYEIVPAGASNDRPGVDPLKYQSQGIRPDAMNNAELLTVKFRYKEPAGSTSRLITRTLADEDQGDRSADFRFAAAVAEFGMLLSQSEFRGDASFEEVLRLASGSLATDPGGYRHEFLQQVRTAQALSGAMAER